MNNGPRENPQDYIEKKSDKNKQPNDSDKSKAVQDRSAEHTKDKLKE